MLKTIYAQINLQYSKSNMLMKLKRHINIECYYIIEEGKQSFFEGQTIKGDRGMNKK